MVHDRHGGNDRGGSPGLCGGFHRAHGLATQTKAMAEETQRAANAAEVQAKATEVLVAEAQLDREASWSPYLTRNVITATMNPSGQPNRQGPPGYSEKITLANVGRGQAVNCSYVFRRSTDNYWCMLRHPGLSGGDSASELAASPGNGDRRGSCSSRRPTIRIRRNALRARSSAKTCSGTASGSGSDGAAGTSHVPRTNTRQRGRRRR